MSIQTKRMPVVYIAGPFRGPSSWAIEQNIRRAETLALKVWKMGAAVICPHANTRFFQGEGEDDIWLQGDLEMIRRVNAILMTNDWQRSSGARDELEFANELQIPAFFESYDDELDGLAEFIASWVPASLPTSTHADEPYPVL
ncbi:hypothetical protein LCGC14_0712970 [marine sediment metagenome]|uniref:Nucleoside 2-deoxyribosyltransferase n=1 Tax=marine sediment metagenome TaxID=412755 RepID=A0A0F9QZZ8_9ZZZZ